MNDFVAVTEKKKPVRKGRKPGFKPNAKLERNPFTKVEKEEVEVKQEKKGKRVQFRPAAKLGGFQAPDGYVPRWVNSADTANVMRKQQEGWEFANSVTMPGYKQLNEVLHGKEVTESNGLSKGVIRHNEMVAMVLPQEIKESRDEYFGNLTKQRTQSRIQSKEQKDKLKNIGYNSDGYENTLTID